MRNISRRIIEGEIVQDPGEYPYSGQLCVTRLHMIIYEIAGRRPDAHIWGRRRGVWVFESPECIGVASA
nr:hypothetical protein [uncultured Methanospirillum sp.]